MEYVIGVTVKIVNAIPLVPYSKGKSLIRVICAIRVKI